MKIPRDVNGLQLVKALRVLGYAVDRQKGSHIRLTTQQGEEALAVARSEMVAAPERELAAKFWKIVSKADQVSETFRQIGNAHAEALRG